MQEKTYKKHMVIWVVVTVVLVIVSFYAGTKHATATAAGARGQFTAGGARGGAGGRFAAGGGFVTGDVLSKDATSMTIKMRDGSSKIVLYSGTTQIMKSTAGTPNDVAVGSAVSVQGTQNSDGSVTAQSISLRPQMPQTQGTPAASGTAGSVPQGQ